MQLQNLIHYLLWWLQVLWHQDSNCQTRPESPLKCFDHCGPVRVELFQERWSGMPLLTPVTALLSVVASVDLLGYIVSR